MTFVPLSAIRPRDGQAVIYRLRPNGVQVPATYDHAGPAWVLEGGHRQTARAHHQWTPAPGAAQRFCKHCGERLVRKRVGRRKDQWESPKVFAGRDYCDRACSDAARRKDRSEEKPCAVCGQPARRRRGESSQKWAERQTCSRQCGAIHRGRKFGAAERSRIAERGWETRQAQQASEPHPAPRPRPQAPRPRPERPQAPAPAAGRPAAEAGAARRVRPRPQGQRPDRPRAAGAAPRAHPHARAGRAVREAPHVPPERVRAVRRLRRRRALGGARAPDRHAPPPGRWPVTRRPRHPRPWCCYSRLGKAKAFYGSQEEAQKRAEWAEKHYGDPLEVYPCSVHAGRWHVRKARPAEKKELVGA